MITLAVTTLALTSAASAEPVPRAEIQPEIKVAGAYSFSDELGGFEIRSVSGIGSRADPIVIVEELPSASPVTLVIRARGKIKPFAPAGEFANGFMYLRVIAINASGLPWLEFEFELQEIRQQPSVYGDGLSFDQRRTGTDSFASDRFKRYDDRFEPYDRLIYYDGTVNPRESVEFTFLISDFTPRPVFYLVQDPRIPAS